MWGYGAVRSASKKGLLIHNAPSLTIEAQANRPVRIKWINELVDANGNYLPHLLPVDPTLHWANPPAGRRATVAQRSARLHVPDPRPLRDGLIAATALVHGMTVVTRNVADFEPTGVSTPDPWAAR